IGDLGHAAALVPSDDPITIWELVHGFGVEGAVVDLGQKTGGQKKPNMHGWFLSNVFDLSSRVLITINAHVVHADMSEYGAMDEKSEKILGRLYRAWQGSLMITCTAFLITKRLIKALKAQKECEDESTQIAFGNLRLEILLSL
ncbi:hypothetical protein ACJX0J_016299, partial [Zea mays]